MKVNEKLTPHPDHPMGIDLDLSDVTWSERLYRFFQRLSLAAPETFHISWFSLAISPPNRKKNVVLFPRAKSDDKQPWDESGIVERAVYEAIRYRGWTWGVVLHGDEGYRQTYVILSKKSGRELGSGNTIAHAFLKACNK